MPLVCPFWSDYVKSIEVCPSVTGGSAYFLEANWDGAAPYFVEDGRFTPILGGIWPSPSDPSPPSAFVGTPSEVWGITNGAAGIPYNAGLVVKFFDSVAAEGISWTMTHVSGIATFTEVGVTTNLDMAFLRFNLNGLPGEGEFIEVFDFTPLGGATLRLNLKRSTFLS